MSDRTALDHPPLVVIANGQEWHVRTLESILGPHGYAVLRAYTGKQALERCRTGRPDIIIIDTDLPDMDGLELCRVLRDDPLISSSTPILVTSPGHAGRQKRLAAFKAGAWDFLGATPDSEELPLRLDAYVRAKFDADRAREESLLDQLSGLYNVRGLARRARELGSHAFRNHEALACVVFSPIFEDVANAAEAEAAAAAAVGQLSRALRDLGRTSDAIGRLGPTEFAVIAHGIDSAGAVKLAQRFTDALRSASGAEASPMRIAAGFDVVPDYHDAPMDPADMLAHATMAMRMSRSDGSGDLIRRFESGSTN